MDTYIVRIYRREDEVPNSVVGTVERIGEDTPLPFTDMNGLTRLLTQDDEACQSTEIR